MVRSPWALTEVTFAPRTSRDGSCQWRRTKGPKWQRQKGATAPYIGGGETCPQAVAIEQPAFDARADLGQSTRFRNHSRREEAGPEEVTYRAARRERERDRSSQELLGAITPENPTHLSENQERGGRKRPSRRPRTRECLLKGYERRFRPRRARERYCSDECRRAAREWSRWKAQQSYRATTPGKEKRNGQSRRYRERVQNQKQPALEAVPEAARVITTDFFRPLLRPSRLLPGICAAGAIAASTILLARVPVGHGTCLGP